MALRPELFVDRRELLLLGGRRLFFCGRGEAGGTLLPPRPGQLRRATCEVVKNGEKLLILHRVA